MFAKLAGCRVDADGVVRRFEITSCFQCIGAARLPLVVVSLVADSVVCCPVSLCT